MPSKIVAIGFIIAMVATAIAQSSGEPTTSQPTFSLRIHTEHKIVKPGSDILVNITVTNNLNEAVIFGRFGSEDLIVRDSDGAAPPLTKVGADLASPKEPSVGTRPFIWVGERESVIIPVNVSFVYDFSKPGKYTIQAQRGSVKSNTITVTVAP